MRVAPEYVKTQNSSFMYLYICFVHKSAFFYENDNLQKYIKKKTTTITTVILFKKCAEQNVSF